MHGCCGEFGNRDAHDASNLGRADVPRAPGRRILTKGRIFAHGLKTSWAPRTSGSRGRDPSLDGSACDHSPLGQNLASASDFTQ